MFILLCVTVENENAYLLKTYLFHYVLTQQRGDSVIHSCDLQRCSEYMLKKCNMAPLLARNYCKEKTDKSKSAMLHLPDIRIYEFSQQPSPVAASW